MPIFIYCFVNFSISGNFFFVCFRVRISHCLPSLLVMLAGGCSRTRLLAVSAFPCSTLFQPHHSFIENPLPSLSLCLYLAQQFQEQHNQEPRLRFSKGTIFFSFIICKILKFLNKFDPFFSVRN